MAEVDRLDHEDISSVIKEAPDDCKENNKGYGDVNLREKKVFWDSQKRRDQSEVFTSDPGTGGYIRLGGCNLELNGPSEDYGILIEEDRTGQADWKEERASDYVCEEERSTAKDDDQDTEVIDVGKILQADEEEPDDSDVDDGEFSTAENPVQPMLEFSDMDQLIRAVKSRYINTGAVLKEPRSILGFKFYHYLMVENIYNDSFKIIHLDRNATRACCEIINIHFSALKQNVCIKFSNGVILCNNNKLSEEEEIAMHDRVEEYLSKPFIPYYIKSKKGFNCQTFLEYLRSGEKKPSSEVQNVEERYGKLVSYPINFIDRALFLFYPTTEIFEDYLHMF